MPNSLFFNMRFFVTVLLAGLLFTTHLAAQALKPEGHFQSDSIKVGEPVLYVLTFRYPQDLEVVFPGEKDKYTPFEYLDQEFVPTRTDSLYSFDSVVYKLTTFELDSVQRLALPVYVINHRKDGKSDSTAIYADADSVMLKRLIAQMPDSVNVKANTNYRLVNLQFNYPYLLVAVGALVLISVLIFFVFGKTISRRWQIYRLKKERKRFNEQFDKAMTVLKKSPDKRHTENVLIVWKKYMERLDNAPYTKMTTREIVELQSATTLQENLRAIDRSIYGRSANGELVSHFNHLYEHTDNRFKQRIDDIKHTK